MMIKIFNYFKLLSITLPLLAQVSRYGYLIWLLYILTLSTNADAVTKIPAIKGESFISADYIEYDEAENFVYANGNIRIITDNYLIIASDLIYDIQKDILRAKGEITIMQGPDKILVGSSIIFKDKLKEGIIKDFVLNFKDSNSIAASKIAKRISENEIYLSKTRFTPCTITCNSKPIWQLSSKDTYIDFSEEKIIYRNLFFEVYGMPVFFTPYFSHPTPNAKAQSGILVPSIKKDKLSIPLYLRAKPNMDITLTPRITTKYTIFELEGRHKLVNGYYGVAASYGEVPYKNKRVQSAYISSTGTFNNDHYNYGFDIKHTTDKAYLKNYHDKHDSYLASKIYVNNFEDYDYLLLESLYFEGLRSEDSYNTDPLILPKIRTKNIIDLSQDESIYASIQSDLLSYKEPKGTQIERGALSISLVNHVRTSQGHVFKNTLNMRDDLYYVRQSVANNKLNKVNNRNIPEVQTEWRYPLINVINKTNITLEPITSITIGKKFKDKYNNYGFIDPSKYEIGEENIFEINRYSGIDYHEFGKRLSYGVNMAMLTDKSYYNLFLGQFLHKHNTYTSDNVGNIGKISAHFLDRSLDLFYRFRRDKLYKPIREEVGGEFSRENLRFSTSFVKLENIRKYYASQNVKPTSNHARQVHYDIQYQLNSNWIIGHNMRFDLLSKKIQPLSKSIRVTYFKDCVSIGLKLYDDYTFDSVRGIKKTHSKSVTLGLKVLNM